MLTLPLRYVLSGLDATQILAVFAQHCMVFKVHSSTFSCNSLNPRKFSPPTTYEETEAGVKEKLLVSVGAET